MSGPKRALGRVVSCPGDAVPAVEKALAAAERSPSPSRTRATSPGSNPGPRPAAVGTVRISGLFPEGVDGLGRMATRVSREILESARVSEVPRTDWVRAGRERTGAMRFGERLWVCPTWAELPPDAEPGVVVRLDPGLAFGTGSHPSTALCLRYLEGLDLGGKVVIDYGCGSAPRLPP